MHATLSAQLHAKRTALADLCERYGVARLDLFGSGTSHEWHVEDSDLDFVVVFRSDSGNRLADRYLGLALGLEDLFGRPVDLLTERAIQNPYFRQAVEATRTAIYGV